MTEEDVEGLLRATVAVYVRWIEEGIARGELEARAAAGVLNHNNALPAAQFLALKTVQARLLSAATIFSVEVVDPPGGGSEKPN
jgi:hypothetical protein